jgi:transcriptional regulator of acetoin/glycerol metabolism
MAQRIGPYDGRSSAERAARKAELSEQFTAQRAEQLRAKASKQQPKKSKRQQPTERAELAEKFPRKPKYKTPRARVVSGGLPGHGKRS